MIHQIGPVLHDHTRDMRQKHTYTYNRAHERFRNRYKTTRYFTYIQ